MVIWVTGAKGQLGQCLQQIAKTQKTKFVWTSSSELPLTDEERIVQFIEQQQIKVCINTSAYTAVDAAENDVYQSFLLNCCVPNLLARICKQHGVRLIHCSTDFVFDGYANTPLQETHTTTPGSIYGQSKRRGEELLLQTYPEAIVVRTSWLYSLVGKNFLTTMRRLGRERSEIGVVYDQIGTPTCAPDLAQVLLIMAQRADMNGGIYHYSNEGAVSWYDFAVAIMKLESLQCTVKPILTKDYPTPAKRPAYSVLDKSKIKAALGIVIPHWQDSLEKCIRETIDSE